MMTTKTEMQEFMEKFKLKFDYLPNSREKSLGLTKFEEGLMWFEKAHEALEKQEKSSQNQEKRLENDPE